ncbi:MAG: TonB-dependent siderophore receptor, partial [Pseudomonadota bacterium]
MTAHISQLLGAAALSALLAGPIAYADDSDGSSLDQELVQDEILVVGQVLYADQVNALRTPTPIIDVPQSLSIVTADQILQQGFTSVGDIINYTPGVNTSQGEGHRDAIVFRGVRSTADFFIDGVRDDVQYYRPLYNLEQVEILRGPNALLFGRGGTGGILNRVTKKAAIGETFTGFQTSYDSFGALSGQIDTNFDLSDRAAVRFNAMYESLDNHRDFYGGDRYGINPTARLTFGPSTTLDLSYEYIDHERFIDRGVPTGADGQPVRDFEDIVFGDQDLNVTRLEADVFRAMLQHRFSDNLKGRLSAFYGDYDKSYANFYASAFDPDTNIVGIDGYVDTTQRENLILAGDLIGEFQTGGIGHTIVTGIEFIETQNDNDRFNPVWTGTDDDVEFFNVMRPLDFVNGVGTNAAGNPTLMTFSDLNDDTSADLDVFSAYIQDEIELSDSLDLIVGARFDRFEIGVDNLDPDNLETRSRTDEELSPRFGLVYKPMENVSFYGSYSETFLPASGEQFADINGDDDRLDPSEFTNLEAGVKWDFQPGLSFTAAVFEIEQRAPELDDSTGGERQIFIETEITGFELQLQGQITDQWFVSGGYSYLDGDQADASLRPRELPENMLSLWNAVQLTDQFGIGLGVNYQDESFINNGNTATLPSYTRVDAALYYNFSDNLRLQLNIENLTDVLYFPDSHSTHQASVGA